MTDTQYVFKGEYGIWDSESGGPTISPMILTSKRYSLNAQGHLALSTAQFVYRTHPCGLSECVSL
jgi:hypothetical protein